MSSRRRSPVAVYPSESLTHRVLMSEALRVEAPMDTLHDRLHSWPKSTNGRCARGRALGARETYPAHPGHGTRGHLPGGGRRRHRRRPPPRRFRWQPLRSHTGGPRCPLAADRIPRGGGAPDLGDTPGPLAAIWLSPRAGGGAPEAVGLVAGTGTFGTLPIDDLWDDDPAEPTTWRSRCQQTAAGSPTPPRRES